jgi:hypothetical protein
MANLTQNGNAQDPNQIGPAAFLAGAVALPVLVMTAAAFGSLGKKSGLECFFLGLRGYTPIALSLVTAGYLVVSLRTAKLEAQSTQSLRRSVEHEGRLLAELEGKQWPGRVHMPGRN